MTVAAARLAASDSRRGRYLVLVTVFDVRRTIHLIGMTYPFLRMAGVTGLTDERGGQAGIGWRRVVRGLVPLAMYIGASA
jgi:hypothetical protein